MFRTFRLLILLICLLIVIAPGAAQDDEHQLLQMLALVPDTSDVRETIVSYADYRAMETVRGIDTPTATDFVADTDLSALWIASSMGLSSGMPLHNLFLMLDDMEEAVGFGMFDVDRTLTFGSPPEMGLVLNGEFDITQIGRAFAARDYAETEMYGASLLCADDGCDTGTEMNLANRNPANPFGGEFGRSEPLAMLPFGLLANSADYDVLENMLEVHEQESGSLAAAEDYHAVAEAVAEAGTLIQINFISPLMVGGGDVQAMLDDETDVAALFEGYSAFQPYTVAGLADVGAGDEQIALIAMAYTDGDMALAAAEEVAARLEKGVSLVTEMPFAELLEERGATIGDPYVYESADTGLAIGVVPITYPIPSNEPSDESPTFMASGMGYRFLIDAVFRRDATFLDPFLAASE